MAGLPHYQLGNPFGVWELKVGGHDYKQAAPSALFGYPIMVSGSQSPGV